MLQNTACIDLFSAKPAAFPDTAGLPGGTKNHIDGLEWRLATLNTSSPIGFFWKAMFATISIVAAVNSHLCLGLAVWLLVFADLTLSAKLLKIHDSQSIAHYAKKEHQGQSRGCWVQSYVCQGARHARLPGYSFQLVFQVVFPAYTLQFPSICFLPTAFKTFCSNKLGILTGRSWHFSNISSDMYAPPAHENTSLAGSCFSHLPRGFVGLQRGAKFKQKNESTKSMVSRNLTLQQ